MLFETKPDIAGKSINEIKIIANQFKYRSIIKYINDKVPNYSKTAEESFLLKIIPNYAELSGYVHGGPSADREMLTFTNEKKRAEKLVEIADLSVHMVGSVNSYLLIMLMNFDRSFEKLFIKLRKAL